MKLNSKKILALVLCAVMITSSVVATTLSYYKTELKGSTNTAKVAAWGFTNTTSVTIDLFKKEYDYAKTTGTDNIIAPGTAGSSSITFDSSITAPEVNYELECVVSSATSGTLASRIEYSWNNSTWFKSDEASSYKKEVKYAANTTPSTGDVVLYWRWVDTGSDESTITADNAVAGTTFTVEVDITAKQIFETVAEAEESSERG